MSVIYPRPGVICNGLTGQTQQEHLCQQDEQRLAKGFREFWGCDRNDFAIKYALQITIFGKSNQNHGKLIGVGPKNVSGPSSYGMCRFVFEKAVIEAIYRKIENGFESLTIHKIMPVIEVCDERIGDYVNNKT